jgi:dCTP deaminase
MNIQEAPMRSLLSRDMILRHYAQGNIFISPFNSKDIQTTSVDVRLGKWFFQEQPFRASSRGVLNPFNPEDIRKYWGEPQEPIIASDWMKRNGPLENILPEDKIIILGPGETVLTHTNEFIGGRNCVTTEMRARSSMGRIGITVCKCAGWGDLGFCNRWTMEMSNHLKDTSVVLVVGQRVAQIAFYQVDPLADSSYAKSGGQYQTTDNTNKMMREWSPMSMLPRFSRDKF